MNRILTTHTGSLPRTPKVVELLLAEDKHPGARTAELKQAVREAVEQVVAKQVECGLDITAAPVAGFDWRMPLLLGRGIGHEQAERQEWTDCDVLVVENIFFGQRKALHDGVRLGDIPGIQQEDGSAAIATRIPFTNPPIKIELHSLPDFSWHDGHDLFACDASLHGKDDDHASGCGREGLGLGNG